MYTVVLRKQASKKLACLPAKHRVALAEAIKFLGNNPDDVRLNIKRLAGCDNYRLRVGSWRIIFDRDEILKIISIEKIGSRGDVYK